MKYEQHHSLTGHQYILFYEFMIILWKLNLLTKRTERMDEINSNHVPHLFEMVRAK